MDSAIQLDKLNHHTHFDHNNKKNRVQLLGGDQLIEIQTREGIIKALNSIYPENHDGIYMASYPMSVSHQISLVFDNRSKILYVTNSMKSSGHGFQKDDMNDKKIQIMEPDTSVLPVEDYATQGGVACGMCTYVNTLNIASRLSKPDNPIKLKLDRQLIIYTVIMDCIDSDDRRYIDKDLMMQIKLASHFYALYEESSVYNKQLDLATEINSILDNVTKGINLNKSRLLVAKESNSSSASSASFGMNENQNAMFKSKIPINNILNANSDGLKEISKKHCDPKNS